MSLIFAIACFKLGDWKNWNLYYPTILFLMLGSVTFDFMTNSKPLWAFYLPGLSDIAIDIVWLVVIYPSTALIFLYRMPDKNVLKAARIAIWTVLYTAIEMLLYWSGYFIYMNGWNVLWSIATDLVIFILLYLHHYGNPLIAWIVSIVFFTSMLILLKINPLVPHC